MKHICFFSGDITRCGGTERAATMVASGLSRTGRYKVSILSLVEQMETPFYPIEPEIKRFVLKADRKWVRLGPGYLPFIPKLRRFLKRQQVDVIVDVDIVLDVLTLPAAAGLKVHTISWSHFAFQYEQSVPHRRVISRLAARFADDIITLTRQDQTNYEERLYRRKRITTIENPVSFPQKLAKEREKLLITVGRLTPMKGTDLLAGIIPEVLEQCKDWKWCLLGDGECRELLETVRRQHGLEDRLLLPGVVKDVESWLLRASVMVMASRSEGLGLCLLEAEACGVPCIAFDVPVGPGEIIHHGENGFLVPPFHTEDMAGKIVQLTQDDALRERFAEAAITGMEKYRLDGVLKKWIHLLG